MTVKGKYGGRKVRDGIVVSDKMQKTVLVAVEEVLRHRLYKKQVRRMRRFMAHDDGIDSRMGDRVRIVESAPISRRKRWQVVEVLERAELPEVAAASIDLDIIGEVKREEEEPAEGAAPAAVATAETAEASEAGDEGESVEPGEAEAEPEAEEVSVEEAAAPEPEAEEVSVEEAVAPEPDAAEFEETAEATTEEIAQARGEETAEASEEAPVTEEETPAGDETAEASEEPSAEETPAGEEEKA
jgi:small subunit ribosomal protein S17